MDAAFCRKHVTQTPGEPMSLLVVVVLVGGPLLLTFIALAAQSLTRGHAP
jgi:hypothetical protein